MTKLRVEDISFSYDIKILDKISFSAETGDFVSILGPSGCGKSTLLNIISGLLSSDEGQIYVDGERLSGISPLIAYMPQDDLLMPWRTVIDNVSLPLQLRNMNKSKAHAEASKYFADFGLQGYEYKYPKQLSGGMRQRAAFLRTVMSTAEVLLLDEPFGALDAMTRSKMQNWLAELRVRLNRTIILVTHDIDEAVYLSDRIYVLSDRPAHVKLDIDIKAPPSERNWEWLLTTVDIKQEIHRALEE